MIYDVIETVIPKFNEENRKLLEAISTTNTHNKGEIILDQGEYCNKLWFINEGAVKAHETVNGKTQVTYFYSENMFFTSYYCWVTANPSDMTFVTTEASEIISIDYPKLEALTIDHHIFDRIGRKIAERVYVDEFNLRKLLLNCTALERYEYLESEKPDLFQKFSLKDIASFIGITDVSLSRIRKERFKSSNLVSS